MVKVKKHLRRGRVVKAHKRKVSWFFGGKKYSGMELKSKETPTHSFAITHNGKIKKLLK